MMAWRRNSAQQPASRRDVMAAVMVGLLLSLLLAASCSTDNSTTEPPVLSAEALTWQGWNYFELGSSATALGKFQAALEQNPAYGPAHLGKAWCLLRWAARRQDLLAALTGFEAAMAHQETTCATWAGRAAARLGLGGDELAGAAADAGHVLAVEPDFDFTHLEGFDATDVRFVQAQAEVARGNFAVALTILEPIAACPLQVADSGTWTVGGTHYGSFEGAVLAWLQQLADVAP
jgi:tetratricopeptide (TPR) repeat protein